MLRLRAIRASGEQGVAIVVAISVLVIALALSLTVVTLAVRQNADSSTVRQRAVAVNAAEAAVDATFTTFQTSGLTLPCGPTAFAPLSANVPVDAPVSTIKVDYYKLDGSAMSCADVTAAGKAHSQMRALVTATATTSGAGTADASKRAMQAYVTLKPTEAFDKAIFAEGALNVENNTEVNGNQGYDADVYSNGDISCPKGNQIYQGSIYAQGSVSFDSSCSALGSIWANGQVSLTQPQIKVGGRVISSTSTVKVNNVNGVSGTIMAGGTIDAACGSPKCIAGLVQDPPAQQPFPEMPLSLINEWYAPTPGYVPDDSVDCTNTVNELIAAAGIGGQGRVVSIPCAVNFVNTKTIDLRNDLVIYAKGGFSSQNQVKFTSSGGTHKIYWIVPYDVKSSCSSSNSYGDITTDNQFDADPSVQIMMYTPCDINVANNSGQFGQVYGGTVKIVNHFGMTFRPVPMYAFDTSKLPKLSYKVDIQYKREVRP